MMMTKTLDRVFKSLLQTRLSGLVICVRAYTTVSSSNKYYCSSIINKLVITLIQDH